MRSPSLVVTIAAVALMSPWARAQESKPQVSETELEGARSLFRDGVELQKAGSYAEALDKFQRSARVYPAPTTLVRIAECQAALGKLVDASEKYRQVIRTPLPEGASPAFHQAKEQAKGELAQLEPRIPRLKVEVKADEAGKEGKEAPGGQPPPNVSLQIDGQPINGALVGEPLPVDPGTHKVVVSAPGYTSNEQLVTLGEKETKAIAFHLHYTGVNEPSEGANGPIPPVPDKVPPPQSQTQKPARPAFLIGARLGANVPTGNTGGSTLEAGANAGVDALNSFRSTELASVGGAIGVDVGVRFLRRFYVGGTLEWSGYGKGRNAEDIAPSSDDWKGTGKGSSSALVGVEVGYLSNPEKVGFFGALGLGYRAFFSSVRYDSPDATRYREFERNYHGLDLMLSAGMSIAASKHFVIIPKATLTVGSYGSYDQSCKGSPGDCSAYPDIHGENITDSKAHAFLFIGAGGYYTTEF